MPQAHDRCNLWAWRHGGGVGLALSCDFRVADQSAYFAIPAARLSNVYGIVETRALFDAVGMAAAKEVLFTGRRYSADEALRMGLATHTAQDSALQGAIHLADSLRVQHPSQSEVLRSYCRPSRETRRSGASPLSGGSWMKRWQAPTTGKASPPLRPSGIHSSLANDPRRGASDRHRRWRHLHRCGWL